MRSMLLAAAAVLALAGAAATPAAATTYDAFTSFDGTQGAGGFYYGLFDDTGPSWAFTPFTANTNCAFTGSTCLQLAADGNVPGAYKSTTTSFQYNSVNVPDNALLLHPGPDAGQDAAVFFIAPKSGMYTLSVEAFLADIHPTGVIIVGIDGNHAYPINELTAANPSLSFNGGGWLNAGEVVGIAVDYDGTYNNDSTGLNVTFTSSAPEPAAWAFMIAGFALAGAALRRRLSPAI